MTCLSLHFVGFISQLRLYAISTAATSKSECLLLFILPSLNCRFKSEFQRLMDHINHTVF